MSDYFNYNNELYHYGVKGMKWGVRKAQPRYGKRIVRGHGGPGVYIGKKRQLAGDKRDLDYMNKGGHLSIGLTKKRQAALDKRDRKIIEDRIAKNELALSKRAGLDAAKAERKVARKEYNKAFTKAETFNAAGMSPIKQHRMANERRWGDVYDKAKALNDANARVKAEKKAYKTLKKMEKQQYKDAIKNLRKEINAGESVVGRLYNKITDADKYQAEIMYKERNRNKR